jgi:hypothetical protein
MRIVVVFVAYFLSVSLVSAQSTTYSTWKNPDVAAANAEKLEEVLIKLNTLIDKAEKAKAADPVFLQDLRNLVTEATGPSYKLVFDDTFADGNFTAGPVWQVSAGEYWIEKGWGLRTSVDAAAAAKAQAQPKKVTGEQAAAALFGQLLNQAIGGKQQAQQAAPPPAEAVIHTNAQISNSFTMSVNVYTGSNQGDIEVAAFQGQFKGSATSPGYRLKLNPQGRIELLRVSSRGTTVIGGTNELPQLHDKKFHNLSWTRGSDGTMTISIDGTVLLSAADLGFKDAFAGVAIINKGGDYIFKHVRVDGV